MKKSSMPNLNCFYWEFWFGSSWLVTWKVLLRDPILPPNRSLQCICIIS